MKRAEKRDHLIGIAAELFNRLGYHAAGVDRVIEEAGIAKTTLYRHFGSKEGLIVAVLRQVDERFRDEMRRTVEAATRDPRERLLATFDYLESWFRTDAFLGCPFMAAAGEFSDRSDPVFKEALMHKRLVIAYFEELARGANLQDPRVVAQEIQLLHEGATAMAHITGDAGAARRAKAVAARLLDASTPATPSRKPAKPGSRTA